MKNENILREDLEDIMNLISLFKSSSHNQEMAYDYMIRDIEEQKNTLRLRLDDVSELLFNILKYLNNTKRLNLFLRGRMNNNILLALCNGIKHKYYREDFSTEDYRLLYDYNMLRFFNEKNDFIIDEE